MDASFQRMFLVFICFSDRETLEQELNRILMTLNTQTECIDKYVNCFAGARYKRATRTRVIYVQLNA